ncbi:MAG: DUF2177 family protein [Alphaproteobacteria bacterium]|nr:DUF2177 family protein [Alphaproteobacteria bacterium]MBV9552017.1 DUF2177 family protein [Alphaproteobacteria bacterium]
MKLYLLSYVATAAVFLGCDVLWLTVTGSTLYRPLLGDLLLPGFRPVPAVLFYLVYMAGLVLFAVSPAIASGRWTTALINGACLGFVAYATYDLTNQATLRSWSTTITVLDLCWGTVLSAIAASLGYVIASAVARATGG